MRLICTSQNHGPVLTTSARSCPACRTPLPLEAQFCMHCGVATPTDPGVPPRVAATGAFEVAKVTAALVGRYKVEKVIGEGGMATVYLATDQKHKRKVAVKVMRPELAATLGAERFLREVEIAGQLSHPHILPMYDSGESEGLRAAIESGVAAPAIAAHFAGFQETSWMLEDRERRLVFRLTPSAFDNDRAFWGQSLATAYWQRGDLARARAYADSALATSKSQAEAAPKDAQLLILYGLMQAYLGKATEARAASARALELEAASQQRGYILLNAARIELALGNPERAVELLAKSRMLGGYLSPQFMRLDPTFASLKGNAAFEKLLAK